MNKTYTKGDGGSLIILASFANDSLSEAVFSDVNQKTSKDFSILVMETDGLLVKNNEKICLNDMCCSYDKRYLKKQLRGTNYGKQL